MSQYNNHISKVTKEIMEENPGLNSKQAFILATHDWNNLKKREQKGGRKREPTEHNLFMSEELRRQKELHPDEDQTQIFRRATKEWNKTK